VVGRTPAGWTAARGRVRRQSSSNPPDCCRKQSDRRGSTAVSRTSPRGGAAGSSWRSSDRADDCRRPPVRRQSLQQQLAAVGAAATRRTAVDRLHGNCCQPAIAWTAAAAAGARPTASSSIRMDGDRSTIGRIGAALTTVEQQQGQRLQTAPGGRSLTAAPPRPSDGVCPVDGQQQSAEP
jgi:hypothetical protein